MDNAERKNMNKNQIENGDEVNVNMNAAAMTLISNAEVLHVPCAEGDSWHFKDLNHGNIIYTSERVTVTLLKKHTPSQDF